MTNFNGKPMEAASCYLVVTWLRPQLLIQANTKFGSVTLNGREFQWGTISNRTRVYLQSGHKGGNMNEDSDSISSNGTLPTSSSSSSSTNDTTSNSTTTTTSKSSSSSSSSRNLKKGTMKYLNEEGSRDIKQQQQPVRRYKNSPFGLTQHYLAMPNKFYGQQVVDDLSEDEEDSEGLSEKSRVEKALNWSKQRQRRAANNKSLASDQGSCQDLSPSSGSSSQPWLDYQPLASQPKPMEPIEFVNNVNHHHFAQPQPPAGDAGLDAKKCNAKKESDYSYPSRNQANLNDLEATKKLAVKDDSSSLLVKFSSIMYATFLVILGCILHVSELRQKSKNSSDHIYTTIVALVGISWLLFLQADLQRYKRYASKYILIETIFNDHKQNNLEARKRELALSVDPSARSTTSSSASLVNDRLSMNTEVIFKKTAYKMHQQRAAAYERQKPGHKGLYHIGHHHLGLQPETPSVSSIANSELERTSLVPAYKFLHGKIGANFYLKCGMAAFCFGHVIHEGLRFGQQLYFFSNGNVHCRDSAALVAHLVTPLYSFYQLFMMFKYSNLVINRHKIAARFGLMHIIGTSVTFWFRTILEEAFEDFVHKMDYFKTNRPQINLTMTKTDDTDTNLTSLLNSISNAIKAEASERTDWTFSSPERNNITIAQSLITLMSSPISATITPQMARHLPDSYACAQNTLLTTKSMNALPYLYPFTIEYNLLLAATFLSLYFNIGKIGPHKTGTCRPLAEDGMYLNHRSNLRSSSHGSILGSSDNSSAMRMSVNDEKDMGEYKSNFVVNADCHSANKGLFCGFFVLLVTLVTIVIFFVTINKPTHIQLGIKINLIQEAALTVLILVVTLAAFRQIVKLNRNPYLKDKVTTDDVLMLIPLPFFFIHSLLSFRAETASISSNSFSSLSSILLHGNNQQDSIPSNGNLQSILMITNNNNTQLESRSRLNNLLSSNPNGTNGRFVKDFISNTNSNISINNNRNGRDIGMIGAGNSSQIDHFKLITVVLNIVVMIEVLVQTNFIIDGMRRCSESRYLRFKKPGRELITFAILLNITYWIVATFETKSVEQYKTEIEYYGPLPYMFISHTTLPVMLFYRYHSSVCLAEIWNRAYKPPKKR